MNRTIDITAFDYPLPDDRIALYPAEPRDGSKLLLYKQGDISETRFSEISKHLPQASLLVFNNTRVIPARLIFQKPSGAIIEIFLLSPISHQGGVAKAMQAYNPVGWQCIVGNKKKWRNETLEAHIKIGTVSVKISATWLHTDNNHVQISWSDYSFSFAQVVQAFGQIPLPPYLKRTAEDDDATHYQTVYARHEGAVAAPTAGLHFTEKTFSDLADNKIKTAFITLHVGAGTFQPVKAKNAIDHDMHAEQISFEKTFIVQLLHHSAAVIPVGTTSMRSLESLFWFGVQLLTEPSKPLSFHIPKLYPYTPIPQTRTLPNVQQALRAVLQFMDENGLEELAGETEIFILPDYRFNICTGIITNFHQPKSTLLLLIAALIGSEWQQVYRYAMNHDFRFLSYGDSSLLIP